MPGGWVAASAGRSAAHPAAQAGRRKSHLKSVSTLLGAQPANKARGGGCAAQGGGPGPKGAA